MRLTKIEINGFKSFEKKTELLINRGITGIVGPKRSGKSNIADAIRWSFGRAEQQNLRGTKMEDVIFGGTQNRAKKAFCEVTLFLTMRMGALPAITAKLLWEGRCFALEKANTTSTATVCV